MQEFISYIDETIDRLQKEEQSLLESDRKDEANFVKIRVNICDICKTIYNATAKRFSGEAVKEEYLRQLTRLPENWKISLEKARQHEDVQKILIEEAKLETLEAIKAKFIELGA